MWDGAFIGAGIAAAGWFIARRIPRPRASTTVTIPEVAELAKALRYMAKSARGAVVPPKPKPQAPDPREATMTAWLSRNPRYAGVEREHLLAAWHFATGIAPGTAEEVADSLTTLRAYGAPLPSDVGT